MIKVKRIGDHEFPAPKQANPGDAGYDLIATQPFIISPGECCPIPTGFAWEIPEGWVGLIWPRSGMSIKRRLAPTAGVIDSSYRGEVHVALVNDGDEVQVIEPGDRLAQMVVKQHFVGELEVVDELSETQRGEGKFGSTGTSV